MELTYGICITSKFRKYVQYQQYVLEYGDDVHAEGEGGEDVLLGAEGVLVLPAHHQLCVVDDAPCVDEGPEREYQGVLALEQALGQMDQEERPDEENAAQHASTGGKVPLGLEGEERQADGDGGSDASCLDDGVLPDLRRADVEHVDADGGHDQVDREDAVDHLDEGAPELAKVWKFVDVSFLILTKETQTGKLVVNGRIANQIRLTNHFLAIFERDRKIQIILLVIRIIW